MFCKNCGQEIAEGAAFCPNCNTPVVSAPQPQPVDPVYGQQAMPQQPIPPQPPYGQPTYTDSYMQQPYNAGYPYPQVPPKPALTWLIVNIVLMVLSGFTGILSIIGTIFGALGQSAYNKGNYADAESKTKVCKVLGIIGLVCIVLAFFLGILFGITGAFASSSYYY